LRTLAPAYLRHVLRHPHSLLVRLYGLYTVGRHGRHVLLMQNVFAAARAPLRVRYDLKGSSVDRRAGAEASLQKDADVARVFRVGDTARRRIVDALVRDAGVRHCIRPTLCG
jgi:1-phosphatidylinositol-4-phosphate 5-kinase